MGFEYRFIVGEMQQQLVERTSDLMSLVISHKFDSIVFIDRSARPAAWIFEAFWSARYSNRPLPSFVFINTGKKKNLSLDYLVKAQIKKDLGLSAENALRSKNVLIVDDIEHDGVQRKFVEQVLYQLYGPKEISYFEWNKLGGLRLPHGLSYEDDGSFGSTMDESKKEIVEQVKREILQLSKIS